MDIKMKRKPGNTPLIKSKRSEESPLLIKGYAAPHKIQGIYKKEGLFAGISAGAALNGALKYINERNLKGKRIVVIFPEKGDRYSW